MTEPVETELQTILDKVFAHDSTLYQGRGFQRRIGYGRKPALINIDLANAWTKPGNPFACVGMETIIPGVQQLLAAFRARNLPIVYTTTAYDVTDGDNTDMGLWHKKIPAEVLKAGSDLIEIDERIAPMKGEHVIVKKRASAFHGTFLAGMLRAMGVDTVIVTGTTASACVRNTVEDAIADGFRPIVPRECVGDRIVGAVACNLFDIDAKFGDVEPLESVLAYLKSNTIDV
jgi:nicotinamidase-related amidase